ncbi:MAG: chemotaxis protein CheW [Longimicrobiales bacterium]
MAPRPDLRNGRDQPRAPIDWDEIRRRVDEAGASSTREHRSPESVRALLDLRARRLAEPEHPRPEGTIDTITFRLAGETYAIGAEDVSGVFPLSALTPVPGASDPVLGITEWRGDLLTILDLRRLLGLPLKDLNDLSMVVVLGSGRPVFGVLADTLIGLASVVMTDLYRPEGGAAATTSHVRGLTQDAIIVLNAESLLANPFTRSE